MAIDSSTIALLKQTLKDKFVPLLPPLLDQKKTQEEKDKKNISRALSAFVIHHLCMVTEDIAAKSVVDDFDDGGIDAIFYHVDTIYLIQSKLKESEQFQQEEAQAFCAGIRQLLQLNFTNFNDHIKKRQTDIEDCIDNCTKIKIVIAHVGSGVSQNAVNAITQLLEDEGGDEERLVMPYVDVNAQKITEFIRKGNSYKRVDAKIYLECNKSIGSPRKSYFGLVSVNDLVELHIKHDKALYEKNIRTFLGMGLKQGVNEAIQQTLELRPQDFCYLNNGVTALCEIIDPKGERLGRRSFQIRGLSIINGAQTISSCAHAKAKGIDISKAKVMLTLITGDSDSEFGKSVTKARNHQNPVSLADFVALEEDQERLRREAAYLDIHYEYKAGVSDQSDPTKINITEAVPALALLHQDPRYAVWLKKEPGNLFQTKGEPYKGLFPTNLSVHSLINAVSFYRYIQTQIAAQVKASTGLERLAYKHGSYALAWVLSKRIKNDIFAAKKLQISDLETAMSIPFDQARNRLFNIAQQQGRSPLSVFRNQTYAVLVIRQLMLEDYGLTNDPVIPHKEAQYSVNQLYPVTLFDYMISKAPQIKVGP
jgi:hypothetical protein